MAENTEWTACLQVAGLLVKNKYAPGTTQPDYNTLCDDVLRLAKLLYAKNTKKALGGVNDG